MYYNNRYVRIISKQIQQRIAVSPILDPIARAAVTPVVFLGIASFTVYSGLFRHLITRAVADITEGSVEGATGGIQTAITEAVEKGFSQLGEQLQNENFGRRAGEGLKDIVSEFIGGTGVDSAESAQKLSTIAETFIKNLNAGGVSGAASAEIDQILQNLLNGIDAGKIGETLSDKGADFFNKMNAGKVVGAAGDQLNDAFDTAFDNLDAGGKARRVGDELRDALKQGTEPLGKGAREASANIFGEVAKGATLDILPWIAAGTMLVTAAPLSMYYLYYRAKHYIGSPKLATEVHQRTMLTPFTEKVGNVYSWATGSGPKPIYNQEITRRISDITRATQNIRKNSGYFQNVLFYGPGGTGKTMISEYIAKNSGMSYIKMSGGDLAQYIKRGEHVTELNKLLDKMNCSWRPWSTQPWVFFIDEAESLCRDRSKIPTAELLELQNAFLNRTGTQSRKFMIILSSNRMEDIDEAVLSRMDHKIYIGPPAEPERVEIIKSYLSHFFTRSEQASFFTDPQVAKIANTTDGLTGRAIFKLLNSLANKKACTDDAKLTQSMIDETVRDFMLQEQEVAKRRALKEKGQTAAVSR